MMKSVWIGRWAGILLVSTLLVNPLQASTPLSSVRVVTLGASELQESRQFVGRVDAISSVDLAFQVGGRIQELPFRQGSRVEQGVTLASLDSTDYQLALERAEIEVARAERDRDRKVSLYERNSVPRAALDEAEDQLRLARVAKNLAQRDLAHTVLKAPFDALVSRRLQEEHAMTQGGAPVVRIQDVTELRVHISVPEDLIHLVTRTEDFTAWLKIPDRENLELHYREHVTEPDPVIQTYQVTLGREQHPEVDLLPGRTVKVRIETRLPQSRKLRVPISALQASSAQGFFVWIYDPATGRVESREVTTGPLGPDEVVLLSGVEAGEQVVTAGGRRLHAGMQVKPFEAF